MKCARTQVIQNVFMNITSVRLTWTSTLSSAVGLKEKCQDGFPAAPKTPEFSLLRWHIHSWGSFSSSALLGRMLLSLCKRQETCLYAKSHFERSSLTWSKLIISRPQNSGRKKKLKPHLTVVFQNQKLPLTPVGAVRCRNQTLLWSWAF